ncbi:MAG: adenylosuccinate lyase [Actinobacteria bacterium]|nr:adenylosuccinate lyase [Actinomycetota bacterium]
MSISRYSNKEMADIWSEQSRFNFWLEVELAVCEAMRDAELLPEADFRIIKEKASFSLSRIAEIESVTNHELVAFIENVAENVGEPARFLHFGLTSSDVMDTALSLQITRSLDLIRSQVKKFMRLLAQRGLELREIPMMGRTHGVHAEPITLGFKLGVWAFDFKRHLKNLDEALEKSSVGKISGAVGTYSTVDSKIEEKALHKLGLNIYRGSTQVIGREMAADVLCTLAVVAGTIEKISTDVRSLQRTEIGELNEPFTAGQKGSSAMPHKKNPILCERLCGLARLIRGYAMVALENIALWGERDISHSSAERFELPQSFILLSYMLDKLFYIISNLVFDTDRMKQNIDISKGRYFSQKLMLELIKSGKTRKEAYENVQRIALRSHQTGENLQELAFADEELARSLSPPTLKNCFDLQIFFRGLDKFFERLGELLIE